MRETVEALLSAFAERAGARVPVPGVRREQPAAPARVVAPAPADDAFVPRRSPGVRQGRPVAETEPAGITIDASLLRASLAQPGTLAAALVAAEILAPPVALRVERHR